MRTLAAPGSERILPRARPHRAAPCVLDPATCADDGARGMRPAAGVAPGSTRPMVCREPGTSPNAPAIAGRPSRRPIVVGWWAESYRSVIDGRLTNPRAVQQRPAPGRLASLGRDEGPADDRRNGALPHAEEEIAVRAIEQGAGEGRPPRRSPPAAVPRERRARGSRSRRPARPLRAHPPRGRLSPGANRDRGSGASQGVESHAQVHEARSE